RDPRRRRAPRPRDRRAGAGGVPRGVGARSRTRLAFVGSRGARAPRELRTQRARRRAARATSPSESSDAVAGSGTTVTNAFVLVPGAAPGFGAKSDTWLFLPVPRRGHRFHE